MNGEGIDYGLESGMLAAEQFLADPATAPAVYDQLVGERFDSFLRTGRRFSFLIGHPWLLKPGLRIAVGTQAAADITLAVMGNLVDSRTPGAAGTVLQGRRRCAAPRRPVAASHPRRRLTVGVSPTPVTSGVRPIPAPTLHGPIASGYRRW